jgi:cobaltochelatase CobS
MAAATTKTKTVDFGGIELPRWSKPQSDDWTPDEEDYLDPHGYMRIVAWAWEQNLDTLLIGPTGVGKTTLIRAMAAKLNRAYRRFPCHEATDAATLLGKDRLGKMNEDDEDNSMFFQTSTVYDAVLNGHILLLDEYNAAHPDVRIALNPLHIVDEGVLIVNENEGEIVPRHEDFRLVATGNPYNYAGVKEWNPAILSRFDVVIEMDYLPEQVEADLLRKRVPGAQYVDEMVAAVNAVRAAHKDQRIRYPVSTRELVRWAEASLDAFSLSEAAKLTIVNKCDPQDRDTVHDDLLASKFAPADWK